MAEKQTLPARLSSLTAADVFAGDAASVEAVLDEIETAARSIVPDVTTRKGRENIASVAAKVARSKTLLDGMGKDLVAAWKQQAAAVDAQRRTIRERLDALKAEVRQPLTDYEQREADRQAALQARVGAIREYQERAHRADVFTSAEEVAEWITEVAAIPVDETFAEFQAEAQQTKDATLYRLDALLTRIRDREAEEARQEAERQEAERQAREEREAEIKRQAAENARREAEQAAAAEQQRIIAARDRAARGRIAAEHREIAAREAQAKAEREASEAQQRAEQAAETERKRIATEQAAAAKAERQAREAREADREHRAMVNRTAAAALVEHAGLTEEQARPVLIAIIEGRIPAVSIAY